MYVVPCFIALLYTSSQLFPCLTGGHECVNHPAQQGLVHTVHTRALLRTNSDF